MDNWNFIYMYMYMYHKWNGGGDNLKQTLKFFVFSILKDLANEQILTKVKKSFLILETECV